MVRKNGKLTVFSLNIADTTYAPRAVTDDCDYTTIPLKEYPATTIYPNPTSGKLVLEFSSPLTSENYLSVYDHTGSLIFHQSISLSKEKIEIDLSGFGKGLYMAEVMQKDFMSVKKVVVE